MPQELFTLLVIIGLSIVVSIIIIIPVILWRIIKKRPILPKGEKFQSPKIFYFGILLFGCFGVFSFVAGMSYLGSFILLIMFVFIGGLIAHKKGWRG